MCGHRGLGWASRPVTRVEMAVSWPLSPTLEPHARRMQNPRRRALLVTILTFLRLACPIAWAETGSPGGPRQRREAASGRWTGDWRRGRRWISPSPIPRAKHALSWRCNPRRRVWVSMQIVKVSSGQRPGDGLALGLPDAGAPLRERVGQFRGGGGCPARRP